WIFGAARCSPQPTGELCSRAHAELGVDMGQMTRDRPFGDKQGGGDLPVRATFCNEGSDAVLGRRQALLAPAPADAPQLVAGLLDPGRGPELFETVERSLARLARAALLPSPHPDDAESEQCPSSAERVSDLLVLRNRSLEEGV